MDININTFTYNKTLLMLAARGGKVEEIISLINKGADIHLKDVQEPLTALDYAMVDYSPGRNWGRKEAAFCLMSFMTPDEIKAYQGYRPLPLEFINEFQQELQKNIKEAYKIMQFFCKKSLLINSENEQLAPSEIIMKSICTGIGLSEALPKWYRHRAEKDLNSMLNSFKGNHPPALLFSHKRKAENDGNTQPSKRQKIMKP